MSTDPAQTQTTPQTAEPVAAPQTVRAFNYSTQDPTATPAGATEMKGSSSMQTASKMFLPLCLVVVVAGVLTGLGLNKLYAKGGNTTYQGQSIEKVAKDVSSIQNGQVFGSADEKNFKDSAEGYLEVGGIDGEGSHHLLRAGGISQTVYLTSSVTDLSKFEGMEVKVWGETFKGQKAGWLMDVGRVQVQNTKGAAPTEK
jgi:hypothetical protein